MTEGAPQSAEWLTRLDAVGARLAAHAGDVREGLTAPDPQSGERWDAGQVWAHLGEFVPYWVGEVRGVAEAYSGEPVPFGRTKTDPGRVAAIERDRVAGAATMWARLQGQLPSLRELIGSLDDRGWEAEGLHPTLGVMPVPRMLEEFLVGHLEQHADQLDALR